MKNIRQKFLENSSSNQKLFLTRSRIFFLPQIRNPTKVSERCGPNRQECDFSSLD